MVANAMTMIKHGLTKTQKIGTELRHPKREHACLPMWRVIRSITRT